MAIEELETTIKEALKELNIKDINEGTSTGMNNFSSGEILLLLTEN